MTLDDLVNETLSQKSRRRMQQWCLHTEVYSSVVASSDGTFSTSICLDCGKSWNTSTEQKS